MKAFCSQGVANPNGPSGGTVMASTISVPGIYQDQQAEFVDNADQFTLTFSALPVRHILRIENVTCGLGSHTVTQAIFSLVAGGEVLTLVPGATVRLSPPQLEFQIPLNNAVTFYINRAPEIRIFLPTAADATANCTITGQLIRN
jgi:hypothetical protein